MKKLNLLLTAVAMLGLTSVSMAQLPNYVPPNGLASYWPFNGNANDQSMNGKNGNITNAIPTTDRFGNSNSAYYFNGINSYIKVPDNNDTILDLTNNFSFSVWVSIDSLIGNGPTMLSKHIGNIDNMGTFEFIAGFNTPINQYSLSFQATPHFDASSYSTHTIFPTNTWINYICTYDLSSQNFIYYVNGIPIDTITNNYTINNTAIDFLIGCTFLNNTSTYDYFWKGKIDDIGIWHRVLTQQEITNLYNAVNCANNTAITQQTNALGTSNTATFTASTSDPSPSYVWQSDFGQGFQTLNNVGNYSGTKTNKLSISNVQLRNHMQPFRVITTSGNCIDTSNVANIMITDTCILTKTDTIHISVTDTLIINTKISGITPPGNTNTIKVFPNPTYDHITINYGNFAIMSGYQLKIENSLGQQVFQTNITQPSNYLSLATWGGKGLYIVKIINPQGNTIEIRKIILQ